jgi:hypothetical protein
MCAAGCQLVAERSARDLRTRPEVRRHRLLIARIGPATLLLQTPVNSVDQLDIAIVSAPVDDKQSWLTDSQDWSPRFEALSPTPVHPSFCRRWEPSHSHLSASRWRQSASYLHRKGARLRARRSPGRSPPYRRSPPPTDEPIDADGVPKLNAILVPHHSLDSREHANQHGLTCTPNPLNPGISCARQGKLMNIPQYGEAEDIEVKSI